jgi:phosphoribosylglycinamide formyltransferase-1
MVTVSFRITGTAQTVEEPGATVYRKLMLRFGILASHRGSNTEAVIRACADGTIDGDVAVVISNNARARVLGMAASYSIPTHRVGGAEYKDERKRDETMARLLAEHCVGLVVLLGYMRILGPRTIDAYRGRILNTHPALLPRFGGRGMYGERVHRAVIASGETTSGVTIHTVDERYDNGPIIAQCTVPVLTDDTPESLAARIAEREHGFVVETLARIARGELPIARP